MLMLALGALASSHVCILANSFNSSSESLAAVTVVTRWLAWGRVGIESNGSMFYVILRGELQWGRAVDQLR